MQSIGGFVMKINATIALIDKEKPGFPVHTGEFPIENGVLWSYFTEDNDALELAFKAAFKTLLGVPEKNRVYLGVYCDYIVNPTTGEVETGPAAFTVREFWRDIYNRQEWFIHKGKEGKK